MFFVCLETGENVLWKRPFECVSADTYVREVLTSDLLKTHLGRFYIHPDLITTSPKLLTRLGIRQITSSDLLEVLKSTFSSATNFTDSKTTSKWLLVVDHCLSGRSIQQETSFLAQLKKLSFLPIHNETSLASLELNTVFFPDIKNLKKTSKLNLKILDIEKLMNLDPVSNAKITELLKNLGIKSIEPREVIEHHIIPSLKSNDPNPDLFMPFLNYIFDNWLINSNIDLAQIKQVVRVKTNKGFKLLFDQNIYLTPNYGNK